MSLIERMSRFLILNFFIEKLIRISVIIHIKCQANLNFESDTEFLDRNYLSILNRINIFNASSFYPNGSSDQSYARVCKITTSTLQFDNSD